MINKKRLNFFSLFLFLVVWGSFFAQENFSHSLDGSIVLVEMQGEQITLLDLLNKIDTLPSLQIPRFRTVEGQKQILDMMITEHVFYLKALELGIDQLDEVQEAIYFSSLPVARAIYLENVVNREFNFDPRSVEAYYREHISSYTTPPRITIQHLQTTEEGLHVITEAIARGDDFLDIIHDHTTNISSARDRGFIRNIRLNGIIPGIGQDPELERHISEATVDLNHIYGPFHTETGIHFFRKFEYEPAIVRPFDEISEELENFLRMHTEQEIISSHIEGLYRRYNVVIAFNLLDTMNPFQIPPEASGNIFVQSSRPEIRVTLGEIGNIIRNSVPRDTQLDITNRVIQERGIRAEIDKRVLDAAAADANIIENNRDRYEMSEVRLRVILGYFNQKEINEHVDVSREELLDFYENNTERYTIPAHRVIRQFVASDERAANRHHREIRNMLRSRRDQTDKIIEYITNESLQGQNGGLLEHVYRNNIVPTLGVDHFYNNKIFEARIGVLSDVFRNVNGEFVFFYVVEEIPPRVRPLSDVENSLISIIYRRKVAELFEQVQQDLMLHYNVVTHFDRIQTAITPEELFYFAELSQRMGQLNETIAFFDAVINDYPDSEYSYRALFMKGFVSMDNQNNTSMAIEAFRSLLEKYPDGELHESAEEMLKALENNVPLESLIGY
ncbi:MAG: tetratricopeptide repeat protein [Candidatus Cloacimonetes bacterium]|nr:tetratricopeptide repeat protein [Candidatus Cloacimonadota bacterium]